MKPSTSTKFTTEILVASYPQTDEYGAIIPGPRVSVPVVRIRTEDFVSDYGVDSLLRGGFSPCDVAFIAEQIGMSSADLLSHLKRVAVKHNASR